MRGAPQRGLARTHVPDEIPNFRRYRRATFATPTLPSPIEAKSLAMPSDNRLRFDKEQRRSPIVPQPREPNPQDSISPTETELMTAVRTLQEDRKSTRLNSSHSQISYAVFCLKKKNS